jgi:hypothetical protein
MKIKQLLLAISLAITSAPTVAAESAPLATESMAVMAHNGHDHAAMMGMGKPTSWTTYPTLKVKSSGESRERMVSTVVPQNIVAANVDAYSNNLKDENAHRQLPLEMAGAKLDKPATGGFQMLTAREEAGEAVRVASTVYYFGERGAKNPTAMFMQQKNELEIIPQPYPREHSRYRANEEWKFLVRFNGQPLANQKLAFESQNGSQSEWVTDAQGVATVRMPDDFNQDGAQKPAGGHDHGMRRGADFVLVAELADSGKTYLTAFNASYGADAFDQRNLAMGLGFTLLGMVSALPLLRQRKQAEKKAAEVDTGKTEKDEV